MSLLILFLCTIVASQRGGAARGSKSSSSGGKRGPKDSSSKDSKSSGAKDTSAAGDWIDTTWSDNPFMVKLDVNVGGYSFLCGGSIIATNEWNGKGVILTAAHCLEGARDVNIWIGCTMTHCQDDLATGFSSDHWIIHPEYDESTATTDSHWADNDVAVIFLNKPITVMGASSISLHHDIGILPTDAAITVFGYYGSCKELPKCNGGSDTDTLEMADIHFMPTNECDDIYGSHVTGHHDFCVRDEVRRDGLQGVCLGDSGSPAIYNGKQIGLSSWGPGDCDPKYPTVMTSVPYYYDWISAQCPECVAGDNEASTGTSSAGEGTCTGMESKWDRGCSRKISEQECNGVRRGTICKWIPQTMTQTVDKTDYYAFSGHLLTLGDNMAVGTVSQLHLILLIGLVVTVSAIFIQFCKWCRNRKHEHSNRNLFIADKYYEDY